MRIKWSLLLISMGLIAWLFFSQQPEPSIKQDDLKQNNNTVDNYHDPDKTLNSETEKQPEKKNTKTSELQLILQEIENRQFSDDPYVEVFSLQNLIGMCKEVDNYEELFSYYQNTTHPKQQKAIDALKEQCEHHQTLYPNLINLNRKQQLAKLIPQSRLGLLLEKMNKNYTQMTESERNEIETAVLLEAIREQNSAVLINSVYSYRYSRPLILQFSRVINSQDFMYVGQISQLAITKLACQFQNGQVCEPYYGLMLMNCAEQPNSCGLTFDQWYQINTLQGMKNDVETLMAHLQSMVH